MAADTTIDIPALNAQPRARHFLGTRSQEAVMTPIDPWPGHDGDEPGPSLAAGTAKRSPRVGPANQARTTRLTGPQRKAPTGREHPAANLKATNTSADIAA
jgi:hypothetical protein